MSLGYQFAPIDVDIISHPKAFAAGIDAMGLWLWGQAHCMLHSTDGRIARAAALAAWGGRRNIMLAKRLVDAGLWLAREDGDWDSWNYEAKSPGATSSAERMRKLRAKRRDSDAPSPCDANGDVTKRHRCSTSLSPSTSVTSLPDLASGPAEEATSVRARVLGLDGEGGAAWQAWLDGVSSATGRPVSDLQARDKPDLVAFANAHAGGLRGEALMAWISDTAAAFVRSVDGKFGGFTTKRCRDWLDAGRPDRNGSARGAEITKQPAPDAPWLKLPEVG